MRQIIDRIVTFEGTAELLQLSFVRSALIAAAVLGLVAGLLGPLIIARGMAFAVHGTSELAFTGGAAALVAGVSVSIGALVGAVIASLVFGVLGLRQRERDSVIGVVLAAGLEFGVLLLALYEGRAANKFGLLTGSIVSVDSTSLAVLAGAAVWGDRPAGRVLPAVAVREHGSAGGRCSGRSGVGAVGAVRGADRADDGPGRTDRRGHPCPGRHGHPRGAAAQVTANPVLATVLSVLFAEIALIGGIILSLGPGLPISGYVATIIFLCYLGCRMIARVRGWNTARRST